MSQFAAETLPFLKTLPVPLAALLMQQALRYERMFPCERRELEGTLQALRVPRSAGMERAVSAFAALHLSAALNTGGWQTEPTAWTERITAEMWSSGQIGAFRDAAWLVQPPQAMEDTRAQPRAVVVIYDKRLRSESAASTLFRRLRPFGTHYRSVAASSPAAALRPWLSSRAAANPQPYAHWVVSGAQVDEAVPAAVTTLSYAELQPARQQLLRLMNETRHAEGSGGPEGLRNSIQALTPQQMGLPADADPVMSAFATDVLAGGSGTQLYSTTFVQWTAREVLRRAQPRTLVAYFTPRNQSASMDLRLSQPAAEPPLDNAGSLVDAEMSAHLTYVNLQRLPGAERAHFLVCHEGYGQAVLIGPGAVKDTRMDTPTAFGDLLNKLA